VIRVDDVVRAVDDRVLGDAGRSPAVVALAQHVRLVPEHVGVDRVVARDEHREGVVGPPARPAELLPDWPNPG